MRKKIFLPALSLLIILPLTSCSFINRIIGKEDVQRNYSDEVSTPTVTLPAQTPRPVTKVPEIDTRSNQEVSTPASVPTQTGNPVTLPANPPVLVAPVPETKPQTNTKPEQKENKDNQNTSYISPAWLQGEWVIASVGKIEIDREENYPYINFDPRDNSFYASNGCNVLNGIYTIESSSQLMFHNVLSTMKYCADTPFDIEISSILADDVKVKYKHEIKDGVPYLYFSNLKGDRIMTLHQMGLDFLNGAWKVSEIQGENFKTDDLTIFFDVEERRVHGSTGCNSFNGDMFVDPQNNHSISLTNVAVTMRLCPDMDRQNKMLVVLEMTVGVKATSHGVSLLNSSGKTIMKLVRPE